MTAKEKRKPIKIVIHLCDICTGIKLQLHIGYLLVT